VIVLKWSVIRDFYSKVYMIKSDEDDEFERIERENSMKGQPYIYESKPKWVGLTDEHKEGLICMTNPNPEPHHLRELIDVVEFELKERNS